MIKLLKKGEGLNNDEELSKIKAGWGDCGVACPCGDVTNWQKMAEWHMEWYLSPGPVTS